ncbi:TetR family transcriptional regulator [Pontibacillus yanchengensis]|uniref:TetR family transcriptional regulator n=1 Tax=Pontibacillus yanchengensis TaxID=462910 RepID=A0ACC7VLN0_9BACI|nr:helix-turn-helix domain-containing protein [Pontibacillus yanchengensis]MYL54894.1 TetR family transcriptional regulator [Pontibacillus yanchengensis]
MGLASNKNNEHQKILDAALELFSGQGYEDTTLQQIAIKAETNENKVLHHFESKDDLFIELMATKFKLDQDPNEAIL